MLLVVRRRSMLQWAMKHVISGENGHFSSADARLIEGYDSDVLGIKERKDLEPNERRTYSLALEADSKHE